MITKWANWNKPAGSFSGILDASLLPPHSFISFFASCSCWPGVWCTSVLLACKTHDSHSTKPVLHMESNRAMQNLVWQLYLLPSLHPILKSLSTRCISFWNYLPNSLLGSIAYLWFYSCWRTWALPVSIKFILQAYPTVTLLLDLDDIHRSATPRSEPPLFDTCNCLFAYHFPCLDQELWKLVVCLFVFLSYIQAWYVSWMLTNWIISK